MNTIFHIATRAAWEHARAQGWYTADSLAAEGFIHCSTQAQVIATAHRLFRERRDLVLLCIDTERLRPEIRFENLEGGNALYPHIYGALDVASVQSVHDFQPRADGSFELPAALADT